VTDSFSIYQNVPTT